MQNRNHATKVVGDVLEDRLMMSGSVIGRVVGDLLILRGDGAANAIQVQQVASETMRVTGLTNGRPTRVNGRRARTFSGVKGFRIVMGNGNDRVDLGNLLAGRNAVVRLGAGNDRLMVTNAVFGTNCVFDGQAGNDVMSFGSHLVGRTALPVNEVGFVSLLTVRGGAGVDTVVAKGVGAGNGAIFDMGAGGRARQTLELGMEGASFQTIDLAVAATGSTAFYLGNMDITSQASATVTGGLSVNFTGGNNIVALTDSVVYQSAAICTGNGNDIVSLMDTTIYGQASAITSGGRDHIRATGTTVIGSTYVNGGTDNDRLIVRNSNFQGVSTFHGHAGRDAINADLQTTNQFAAAPTLRSLELSL